VDRDHAVSLRTLREKLTKAVRGSVRFIRYVERTKGRTMTLTALDVAKYFLALQDDEEAISNLKLQKLLYYAQGFHLAITGRALFDDDIRAWAHGPVVPAVWREYNRFAGRPIPRPSDFDPAVLDSETCSLLDEVSSVYGQFSAWWLREMTHSEPPWKSTPSQAVISHAVMETYFKTLTK
jgi:uncharacterized phage-associated protein